MYKQWAPTIRNIILLWRRSPPEFAKTTAPVAVAFDLQARKLLQNKCVFAFYLAYSLQIGKFVDAWCRCEATLMSGTSGFYREGLPLARGAATLGWRPIFTC
ncbi:hypothetical protein TRVL_08727 [Trypanosoma vivax]|nr:hypothetical protein TRVL_08727 [Trypanosoma vivax]